MKYLFRFEIKGIQSFIFSSNKLKEIAGGSAIVDAIFTVETCQQMWNVSPDAVLQSAAGSATILFDSKDSLEGFFSTFALKVQQIAPGVEMTYAWVPYDANNDAECVSNLKAQLQQNRNDKVAQIPELGPLVLRSGRTGGAVVSVSKRGGQLDEASRLKEKQGGHHHIHLEKKLLGGQWQDKLVFTRGDYFENTDEMVAIIHIDGNDIGTRVIQNMPVVAYQEFSNTLSTVTLEATRHAIDVLVKECIGEEPQSKQELPIRPIIVGGDDCTVVVLAQHALLFVEAYVDKFRSLTREATNRQKLKGPMEASAGIAFVKAKAPFAANYHLAEELCSHSKNTLRERCVDGDRKYTPSSVTFYRVTTSAIPKWSTILHNECTSLVENPYWSQNSESTQKHKGTRLMAGPYLLGDNVQEGFYTLTELKELATVLKELPRGPFREWLRIVKTDPKRAQMRWSRMDTVLNDKKTSTSWQRCKELLASESFPTFRSRKEGGQEEVNENPEAHKFVSALGDALTILGFRKQSKEAQ